MKVKVVINCDYEEIELDHTQLQELADDLAWDAYCWNDKKGKFEGSIEEVE